MMTIYLIMNFSQLLAFYANGARALRTSAKHQSLSVQSSVAAGRIAFTLKNR